jgi:hypothetical protein
LKKEESSEIKNFENEKIETKDKMTKIISEEK